MSERRPYRRRIATWTVARVLVVAVLFGPLLNGCSRTEARCREDKQRLDSILSLDRKAEALFHQVDVFATSKTPKRGADLIDRQLQPVLRKGLEKAKSVPVQTRWGRERRTSFEVHLHNRLDSSKRYRQALLSGDKQRLLEVLLEQKKIEQESLRLRKAFDRVPPESSLECQPSP